jgi:methionyl-tRNA formyltransferase
MRIIFLGSDAFALGPLQQLIDAGHAPGLVVTMPDRQSGRGRQLKPTPIKTLALSHRIEVWTPATIRDDEALARLKAFNPDVLVCVAYGRILPPTWLSMPWALNIHPSILPRWRGATPLEHTLLAQDELAGVSIIRMSPEVDAGEIVWQSTRVLEGHEQTKTLGEALFAEGGEALIMLLKQIEQGQPLEPIAQDDQAVTLAPKFTKQDGAIDWHQSAKAIDAKIRALHQWPTAYTAIGDVEPIKIHQATWRDEHEDVAPGTLVAKDHDVLWVQCGQGQLGIQVIQFPGKKAISVPQLQGYKDLIYVGNTFITRNT